VEKALAGQGRELVRTGSPYAVAPGRVRKGDGEPYRVFTPFRRAWATPGWRAPAGTDASTLTWLDPGELDGGPRAVPIPDDEPVDAALPEAGEDAAHRRWRDFPADHVAGYGGNRDRPDRPGTSGLSPLPEVRADPPPHHAGRPGRGRPPRRVRAGLGGDLPHRAGLAGVLRRRPPPAPRLGAGQLRPELRRCHGHRGGRAGGVRRLAGESQRVPRGGRRDAPAARAGVDAQPSADGRGQLPGQGSAPALVVGRAALHAVAGGR
jgi:hypothetical protein